MILLGCRGCGAVVAEATTLVTAGSWHASLLHQRGPIVPVGVVLEWTQEFWTSDNKWLPFPTGSWLLAPDSLIIPVSESGSFGCCGVSPVKTDSGFMKNQFCTCIAALGWIDTDCFCADYVALDPASIDVAHD